MNTFCVRQGQVEFGAIEHEGREFVALGSSVVGRHVTGYTRGDGRNLTLTTWCGKTMIACRCEVVERFWSGSIALMFRLTNNRYIVGYALGDDGMLFRGELIDNTDEDDAGRSACHISECFVELDAEDEEASQIEPEEEPLLDIEYRCTDCGHDWGEQWSCACDSECPECGATDIAAFDSSEAM